MMFRVSFRLMFFSSCFNLYVLLDFKVFVIVFSSLSLSLYSVDFSSSSFQILLASSFHRHPSPMPFHPRAARRQPQRSLHLFVCCVGFVVAIFLFSFVFFFGGRSTAAGISLRGVGGKVPAKAELGRAGWTLLHRVAAKFPKNPTEKERETARTFLELFALMYPCEECAKHFQAYTRDNPPDVSRNSALVMWMCKAHNEVNVRKGKDVYPCTMDRLIARWGTCGCKDEEKAAVDKVRKKLGEEDGGKGDGAGEEEEEEADEAYHQRLEAMQSKFNEKMQKSFPHG